MARMLLDHDLVQPPLRLEVHASDGLDGEREALLDPGGSRQHGPDQRRRPSGSTSVRKPSRPTFTPSTGQPAWEAA